MIARVLIDGPSELVFDYAIPADLAVVEGCRVRVPIRQKTTSGTVLSVIPPPEQSEFAVRELKSLIDPEPLITPVLLKIARWISNYYGSSIESVIRSILPEAVRTEDNSHKTRRIATAKEDIDIADLEKLEKRAPKQYAILSLLQTAENRTLPTTDLGDNSAPSLKSLASKGLITIGTEEVRRDPESEETIIASQPLTLNEQQETAFQEISASLRDLCTSAVENSPSPPLAPLPLSSSRRNRLRKNRSLSPIRPIRPRPRKNRPRPSPRNRPHPPDRSSFQSSLLSARRPGRRPSFPPLPGRAF